MYPTRNKSNASFEAQQYWQDVFPIAHYHKKKHFPINILYSENHNNVCRKSENSWFEIWYSVVASSGGAEKNSNMGAKLQIIPYKKAQKHFLNCMA